MLPCRGSAYQETLGLGQGDVKERRVALAGQWG